MRNRVVKTAVLFAVFVAGVVFFSLFMNTQVTESASDLQDSTLPVMCIDVGSNRVNRMYGYREEMAAADLRDSVIPMTTERQITVSYRTYDIGVSSVTYEVTAPDTGTVIENAKIGNFKQDGEYRTATFSLSEPILMNREYPIKFTLHTTAGNIFYYSRLLQRADLLTEKYVQFVYDFYETCTNKNGAGELNTYLETDDTVTYNSFTEVNLKSTFDQITWGNLNPQIYRKAVPTIKEINKETCSITTDYLISSQDKSGDTEFYHVTEFYRLRYYNDRMMLLDFNRKAIQCYDGSPGSISANGIFLGVEERNIPYKTNNDSGIVAFVNDDSLWEYNENAQKLVEVFTFHDTSPNADERYDHDDYGIRIIRVQESGDIDFIVHGYMNRGLHEGRCGISICHYHGEGTAVEEQAFIPYRMSAELLEKNLERLCYVTASGTAYFYLDRTVYKVDPVSGEFTEIISDINPDCFVSSGTGSRIAWMQEMETYASGHITLMDLDNGQTREIAAGKNQYLKALGFINDDLIYGITYDPDIAVMPAGDVIFAMKELKIEAFDGTLVKDYNPDNCWVSDITITEGLVELSRVTKTEAGYTVASTDNIMNTRQIAASEVKVGLDVNNRQGLVLTLLMADQKRNINPVVGHFVLRPPVNDVDVELGIDPDDPYPLYYVYAFGKLQKIMTDPGRAVREADAMVGVVVNREGQYVYERGNKQTENELYNEDVPEGIFCGKLRADELQEAVGDAANIMNLSGCTLDQALYQVSTGRAVVARLPDGAVTVIVGYDRYNTLLYNFADGSHYYMGINDSTAAFEAGGNVFLSYIEPQKTVKG
ncbi:MAG: hypothetical protein Q4A32_07195 [Lachnospiraceae bacterium]|nr:hypothetical protein [Lachnospiraceae bacterium]